MLCKPYLYETRFSIKAENIETSTSQFGNVSMFVHHSAQ